MNLNTSNRKKLSAGMAILAASILAVGSLAYFTDRVTGQADFSVMEADDAIDIVLTPENPDPSEDPENPDPDPTDDKYDPEQNPGTAMDDWIEDLNATALANLNPGDRIKLCYGVSNNGKLAVDARETIVVRSSEPLTDGALELQLVNGTAQKDTNGAYEVTGSVVPTSVSADKKTITYRLDPYSVKGSAADAESVEGITSTSHSSNYNIVFNKAASNTYQGITVTVDYMVEAKQHTPGDTWAVVATDSISFGGADTPVVPAAE